MDWRYQPSYAVHPEVEDKVLKLGNKLSFNFLFFLKQISNTNRTALNMMFCSQWLVRSWKYENDVATLMAFI